MKKKTDFSQSLFDEYGHADQAPVDLAMGKQKSFVIGMDGRDHALEKLASHKTHIPNRLAQAIRDIQACPDPDTTYVYTRALGAYEGYGPNNNGDAFTEDELKQHSNTFETHGACYRHHQNKSLDNAIGEVPAAAYNAPLQTTDLIMAMPSHRIKKEREKLKNGAAIATSMGAKVPYDVCSVCGNQARRRSQYCGHLRNKMLDVDGEGRIVCAFNPRPTFSDISIVVIPAAPESAIIQKIASLNQQGSSTPVDLSTPGFSGRMTHDQLYEGEARGLISEDAIDLMGSFKTASAIRTLHEAVGPLRPDEFQAVLRKEAACLRDDVVPYVQVDACGEPDQVLEGRTLRKIAHTVRKAPRVPLAKRARLENASNFLTPDESRLYRQYRQSMDRTDRRFLR